MIRSWSHSRYENYKKCHFRAKLLYVDKLEEPRGPLKPGLTEYPNDRGTRVHEGGELFVKGGVELLPELSAFRAEYERLRELYAEGKVDLEGEWGFNKDWNPVAYKSSDCTLRVKLDAIVMLEPTWAAVIDLKTGRKNGNELKHAEQTQLYTVATLMRNPEIERVTTELWYADQNELTRVEYSRDQGLRFFKIWNERGIEMMTETLFEPNPNKYSCQFCHFGPKGNGVCTVGV
jgi:CRISPR/Cas system-associated exonuclease Cas4 (RecB family)